jgi:hypothetical protein
MTVTINAIDFVSQLISRVRTDFFDKKSHHRQITSTEIESVRMRRRTTGGSEMRSEGDVTRSNG